MIHHLLSYKFTWVFACQLHMSDVTFDMRFNQMSIHCGYAEPWRVTLIDTGESTMTGGRLKQVRVVGNETFCFTYGDGVSNVNIKELIDFHKQQKLFSNINRNPTRDVFGALPGTGANPNYQLQRKAWRYGSIIGYFVLKPEVIDYIADDSTVWEQGH